MTRKEPKPLPKTAIAAITFILMLIVLSSILRNVGNRPDIRGNWETACTSFKSEIGLQVSTKQRYQLTGSEWIQDVQVFSDTSCQKPVYTLQTVGYYELGDKSSEIEGSIHSEFTRRELHLTAFTPEAAQIFEQYNCGETKWETNVTTRVDNTGCPGIAQSLSACPRRYDLVKHDQDRLYLGNQAQLSCEFNRWPSKLDSMPFKKIN
jgi:hypothetical protein